MSNQNLEMIYIWTKRDYISNASSFGVCWVGSFLLFLSINNLYLNEYFQRQTLLYLTPLPPILFCFYYLQRNKLVKALLNSDITTLHKRSFALSFYNKGTLSLLLIWILSDAVGMYLNIEFKIVFILFSIMLVMNPFFKMYAESLTKYGAINIEMECLGKYKAEYEKEQYWLRAISKRIRDMLRIGKIEISTDTLTHYFNLRISESDKVINEIIAMKESLSQDEPDYSVLKTIKKIIPENELKISNRLSIVDELIEKGYLASLISVIGLILSILKYFK